MSRPELTGHASLFYNEKEARKYNSSSRMIGIQREITERAIELLRLDDSRPSNGIGVTGKDLDEAVQAIVDGRSPSTQQKPSIGCNIKWKS